MHPIQRILTACQKIETISAVIILNQEGELLGHLGIEKTEAIGNLVVFLDTMGKQLGENLATTPLLSCNTILNENRLITFIYKGVHFGVLMPVQAAVKPAIGQLKKVIENSLVKKG